MIRRLLFSGQIKVLENHAKRGLAESGSRDGAALGSANLNASFSLRDLLSGLVWKTQERHLLILVVFKSAGAPESRFITGSDSSTSCVIPQWFRELQG